MLWKVEVRYKGSWKSASFASREEALAESLFILENLGKGRKEIRIFWTSDIQSCWNLNSFWALR